MSVILRSEKFNILLVLFSFIFVNCVNSQKEAIEKFHAARNAGDLDGVCLNVKKVTETRLIKIGMTDQEIIKILGPFDSWTGIYGYYISLGYGKPNSVEKGEFVEGVFYRDGQNYDFVWFHFDLKDTTDSDQKILILKEWDGMNYN